MPVRICTNQGEWEQWQSAHGGEFLQSWDWGEFQRAVGQEPMRWQLDDGMCVQGFVHRLPLGVKYLYVPRCRMQNAECKMFLDVVKALGYIFVRLELAEPMDLSFIIYHLSFTRNRQPQHTLLIDLTKSSEQMIGEMHPKTRYNIHLAERKGVTVRREKNIDVFWQLNQETTARDRFRGHSRAYYEKMLALPMVEQLTAYVGATPIATNLVVLYGKRATYVHGASGSAHRECMAPYLLQWAGMRLAKDRGCQEYDLWGVAPPNPKSEIRNHKSVETCFHRYCWEAAHPWTGVTRFKAGFGGYPVSYPKATEVIFKPRLYSLYQLARRVAGYGRS